MSFRNLTSLLYSVEKHRKINVISMKFRAQMSLILCVLTLYLFPFSQFILIESLH